MKIAKCKSQIYWKAILHFPICILIFALSDSDFCIEPLRFDSLTAIAKWRLQSVNCKVVLRTLIAVLINHLHFAFFNLHFAFCIEPLRLAIG